MEMKPAGVVTEATRNMTASMAEVEAGGLPSLKSPIPYLFGGLAIIFTLITVALLILACSHLRHSSSSSSSPQDEQESKTVDVDSEPKIVVVMAGDTNPTFLAKPLSSIG